MRDDFPVNIKDVLAKRVGFRCSNPRCRKPTSGPQTDPNKTVNVGVAAHITAASSQGPRYDREFTPQERSSISNGIWLCQTCAKLVDNDPTRYSTTILKAWRDEAEQAAIQEIESGQPRGPQSTAFAQRDEAVIFYDAMREIAGHSPYEAILHSWKSTEAAVLDFARKAALEVGDNPSIGQLIDILSSSGLIDNDMERWIRNLCGVRNQTINFPSRFNYDDAMAYADLTAKTIIALRERIASQQRESESSSN